MLNMKQEKKKKRKVKRSKEAFTYANSRRRGLPRTLRTSVYEASYLMLPQALDIGCDKALK